MRVTRVPDGLKSIKVIPWSTAIYELLIGSTFLDVMDKYMDDYREYGLCRVYFAGRWEVVNGDPELLRKILIEPGSFNKLTPHQFAPNTLIDNMFGTSVLFSGTKDSKRHRRIANPAFKKGWNLDVFSECVEELFEKLGNSNAYNVDIDDLIQRTTIEALGREIMDIKFDTILADKRHKFISYFNDILSTAINPAYFIFPILDRPWNPFRYFGYKKLEYVNRYFDQLLQERKKKIAEDKNFVHSDVLSLMLASNAHDPNGLTDDEVKYNALTFFLAGQDTTTFAICAALHLLAEYPEIQEKMRQEVLTVFGKDEYENGKFQVPTHDKLSKLEYTHAVIKETMRLYPSVSVILHREAQKDIHHRGHTIPAGTIIDTVIYAIHRNPEYFRNPNEFIPSRFLSGEIDVNKFESNWFAFSSGSRACIGAGFSTVEQKVVLSYILRRYKVRPADNLPSGRPLKVQLPFLLKTDNLRLNFELI
jgi:cytochrome P450